MLWRWTLGHLSMPVLEGQDPLWTGRNVLSSSAAPRHGKHGGNTVLFCLVLRQGPPVYSRLVLYSPGWPESHNPPTLASWVLRLWTHAAKACFVCSFFCFPTQICFRARAAMKKFFESKNVRALCLSKNPFVPYLRLLCSPTVSAPSALFIQQSQYCSPLTITYCGREDAWFVNCGQKATVA